MQRDLSGSTIRRNIGVALAHSYLAIEETLRGLERIEIDEEATARSLASHPEVLTEAYQTILRAEGYEEPYELFRNATQGKDTSLAALRELIDHLEVDQKVKYTGIAVRIAEEVATQARDWLNRRAD